MRRAIIGVLGVLLLVSACGSSDDGSGGDDAAGQGAYTEVKSSVDDLVARLLPDLAAALDGEVTAVRGEFVECGVGPQFQKYSVRGELRSRDDDPDPVTAVLADAGLDVSVSDDQSVKGVADGTTVLVMPGSGRPVAGALIRTLRAQTECQAYSDADADAIRDVPAETYEDVLDGTS